MLIPSDRHTAADLAYWLELEAADLAHARSDRMRWLIESAVETVRGFVAAGPCFCGVSWGKDSVAAAGIVAEVVGGAVPLYHVSQPDSDLIAENDAVAEAFGGVTGIRAETVAVRATGRDWREGDKTPELAEGIRQIQSLAATRRWIGGLRRDERGGRQFRTAAVMGASCQPLTSWTAADVFAFLAVRGLPVHPRYAMTGGGRWPRDRIRVCTFGGHRGTAGGRREWEQEFYGDVLRRIEAGARSGPGTTHGGTGAG